MKKIAAILSLVLSGFLFADTIEIPKDKRVRNMPSGVCVWCAVENLANVHRIPALKGIAKYRHDNYSNKRIYSNATYVMQGSALVQIRPAGWIVANQAPGNSTNVKEEFERLGVKYKLQKHGDYDHEILKESMKLKLGCAVGFKDYPKPGVYHMVTLTEYNDDDVAFVDNNGDCERVVKTRNWFDKHWMGFAIMVIPEKVVAPHIEEEDDK